MFSVVILAYNEAVNLGACIASLEGVADDIVVVDSFSEDGSDSIALGLGARVVQRRFLNFADQRNFAHEQISFRYPWILHLDADERMTPSLASEVCELISAPVTRFDAYRVPFMIYLHGRPIKHSGMYPRYQVRFGRVDSLRFSMRGHGQQADVPSEAIGTLQSHLIHYNFSKGISEWIQKHARYAVDEAAAFEDQPQESPRRGVSAALLRDPLLRRRLLKSYAQKIPAKPLVSFLYIFLYRRGFLDGRIGFRYALLFAFYQWMIDLNLAERRCLASKD